MNACHCNGNNSLRKALATIRCECGGSLTTMQVLHRIIDRLDDLDEGESRLIGALQRLGADRCDQCGEWDTDTWHWGDRCRCKRCLSGNPEGVFDETDDEAQTSEIALSVQRYLTSRGTRAHSNMPELKEAYRRITVNS